MLRNRYGINPDELSDDEWCKLYAECEYLHEIELKEQKAVVEAAIIEVLNQVFPEQQH